MISLALLISSFATEEDAKTVICSLVKERLAACGTIIPKAHSIYLWEGKIEEADEVVVLLKTSSSCLDRCMKRLKELHPYEVPEIVALESKAVDAAYLQWMHEVLKGVEVK